MCFLLCAYKSHPRYPLIIAANRDEFHARPASEACFWNAEPSLLAGKDLQAGGTWLGITKQGRIAAVTNFHEEEQVPLPSHSRGKLVSDFLLSPASPDEYARHIMNDGCNYRGFTVFFGTVDALYSCSNRTDDCQLVAPGVHALSNRLFNDNSRKVRRGREALKSLLSGPDGPSPDDLFSLLSDRTPIPEIELSVQGIDSERKQHSSSIFIQGKEFGTRCSTVIFIDSAGRVRFEERTFSPGGAAVKNVAYDFLLH